MSKKDLIDAVKAEATIKKDMTKRIERIKIEGEEKRRSMQFKYLVLPISIVILLTALLVLSIISQLRYLQ